MDFPKFWKQKESGGLERAESQDAEFVLLPIEEYNGYEKAVRVVRDRALQQIEKGKADKHGYTLLRADKKKHKAYNGEYWLVTKTTPYSINIPVDEVQALIKKDLIDFYGYWTTRKFEYPYKEEMCSRYVSESFLLTTLLQHMQSSLNGSLDELYESRDNWNENISLAYHVREYLRDSKFRFSFDMCKLSCNYAQGKYEVSYWQYKL